MLIIGLLKIKFMRERSLFGILQAFLQNLKGTPVKTTTLGCKKEGRKYIYMEGLIVSFNILHR